MNQPGQDTGSAGMALPARLSLKRIFSGGAWLVAERCLRICTSLAVGIWVARHLGPDQFGILGYVAAGFAFLAPLAGLGLDQPALRALATGAPERDVVGTALLLRACAGIVLVATSAIWLIAANHAAPYPAVIAALAIGSLFAAADACEWPFTAGMETRNPALVRILTMCLSAALRITLLVTGAGVVAFAWALAAEMALVGLGLALVWSLRQHWRLPRWDPALARTMLRNGWPLALSGLLIMSYNRIDQLMLHHLAGADEVGLYLAAVRIAESWWLVPVAIASAATAGLVQAHANGREAHLVEAARVFRLQSMLALPITVGLSAGSFWLLPLLFGAQYAAAAPILAVLAWSGWFVAMGVTRSACLTAAGIWRFPLLATGLGAICNVVLNLVLIPPFAGMGAAIATVLAQFMAANLSTLLLGDGGALWRTMTRSMLLLPSRNRT